MRCAPRFDYARHIPEVAAIEGACASKAKNFLFPFLPPFHWSLIRQKPPHALRCPKGEAHGLSWATIPWHHPMTSSFRR